MDGLRAERYEPLLEPRIGVELSRVRTPDEAVSFVTRFGMLTQPRHLLEGESCPAEIWQPFADFERASEDLRRIHRTLSDVRKGSAGDREALARLRKDFGPLEPEKEQRIETAAGTVFIEARALYPPEYFSKDERTILIKASDWAAGALNNGLIDAHPCVFEPAQLFQDPRRAPGRLCVGILAETLLGFCYLTFAQALSTEPIAVCDECNRIFIVDDKRQKFCEPACANRARFRRFKDNRTVKSTPKKRSQHGKTARTRRR
jgi:hypothetical protein